MKHKVSWPQLGRVIEVTDGMSVLEAAVENDLDLDHVCGGFCACTTCHILIKDGMSSLSPMEAEESERIEDADGVQANSRLACQTKVHGDVVIEIPGR